MNKKAVLLFKWLGLSLLTGVLCGIIGTLFAKCITLVTEIRTQNGWLILLLPLGGIISAFIYKAFKVTGMGTNQVLISADGENKLSPILTPAVFICSAVSHLFGASVGREGAALQLGGSTATLISRVFHLKTHERQMLVYCGMAGLFSAVFGTPFAAFAFALEVVYVGHICLKAIIPTLLASVTAYFIAVSLGVRPERFHLSSLPDFSYQVLFKCVVIALFSAFISIFFCLSLKYSEKLFKSLFKNEFLRIAIGGLIIVILTVIIGNQEYNGAGVNIIERIFTSGELNKEAFLLKILFTCVAVAAGFKGGEIIPTLFIGAAFGGSMAILLGLPVSFGAAIGMTALFCGVTSCPLAALLLSAEMFSGHGLPFLLITVIISFIFSGKISLYSAQKRISFKKECSA